ncbi:unnamed protein product [Calypogeia fissa]
MGEECSWKRVNPDKKLQIRARSIALKLLRRVEAREVNRGTLGGQTKLAEHGLGALKLNQNTLEEFELDPPLLRANRRHSLGTRARTCHFEIGTLGGGLI